MRHHPGHRRGANWSGLRALVAVLLALSSWLCTFVAIAAPPVTVTVLEDSANQVVIDYQLGQLDLLPTTVNGHTYQRVVLGRESHLKEAGAPDLPKIARSVLIGADAEVQAQVVSVSYHDVSDIDVVPSKGILYRPTSPSAVPYVFGPSYQTDAFHPAQLTSLGTPYLLRDDRGVVLTVHPFQYNPVQRVLRVYDSITVAVTRVGVSATNVLASPARSPSRAFAKIAQHHFVNSGPSFRYAPLNEEGDLLIIAQDAWLPNLQPLIDHKNAIGIATTAVGVSTIGNDAAAIKAYIQSVYDNSNLAFVLLVGDAELVATPWSSGGASDPSYAKLAGSDHYPDILIGRFSAENAAHVDTQVQRTIAYEEGQATQQSWFRKGIGLASAEGPGDDGEMDWQHIDNIRTDLLGYGFTQVDQLYDPGPTAAQVVSALEDGRGIINYCGHGDKGYFGTSGFGISQANALTNVGMLPFVLSVACNTGEFAAGTSLGEALLRASHNGEPTGAVAMYASSILQSWSPPMAAQDESVDLFVSESYSTLGAICFAGSARMMDEYGSAGVEMYDTWILFGDPSLTVVGVVQPLTGMSVTPLTDLEAEGSAGGPFLPASQIYTVENAGEAPLDWGVSGQAPWLTITPSEGTLAPGTSATVTVSLDAEASQLPEGYWEDTLTFINHTDHDGDTSRHVGLTVGQPEPQYEWPLDTDPGWTAQGQWAFGVPLGSGGGQFGSPDPAGGYTGANVYGYNLAGNYSNDIPEHHLISEVIDCSELSRVSLRFARWLSVEGPQYDHASVSVSNDGSEWTTVWSNTGDVADSSWQPMELDISAVADGQPSVQIRWTMGTTDSGLVASGWNIDDIEIWGVQAGCVDGDGDGMLGTLCGGADCNDSDGAVHPGAAEICGDGLDNDCSGMVDDDPSCDREEGGPGNRQRGGELVEGTICGCRLVGAGTTARWQELLLLGLAGLALGARRRRRSSRLSAGERARDLARRSSDTQS